MLTSLSCCLFGYIGPGAGLGLIGALIMLVVAVVGALLFVVLWPLRTLLRKVKGAPESQEVLSKDVVNQDPQPTPTTGPSVG